MVPAKGSDGVAPLQILRIRLIEAESSRRIAPAQSSNESPNGSDRPRTFFDYLSTPGGTGQSITLAAARLIVVAAPILLLLVLIYGVTGEDTPLLSQLAEPGAARGLITVLFAAAAIWVALMLATFALTTEISEKQFSQGREVLVLMIGILGAVIGYYFGVGAGEARGRVMELERQLEQSRPAEWETEIEETSPSRSTPTQQPDQRRPQEPTPPF